MSARIKLYKTKDSPFWQYAFSFRGNRVRRSSGTDEKELALQIATSDYKHLTKCIAFGINEKPRITMNNLAGKFYEEHAAHLSSRDTILPRLKVIVGFFGKNTYLDEVDDSRIAAFVTHLRKMKQRGKALSNATINRYLSILNSMWNRADKHWRYAVGDCRIALHFLPEPAPVTSGITYQQYQKLIANAPDYLRRQIIFLVHTGTRISEAMTLDWSRVDMDRCTALVFGKSKRPDKQPGLLRLNDEVMKVLREIGPKEVGRVFLGPNNKPINTTSKKALDTLLKKCGITFKRGQKWHTFRHTCATEVNRAIKDITVAKEMLRHKSITTTMKYIHVAEDDVREGVQKMAKKWQTTNGKGE